MGLINRLLPLMRLLAVLAVFSLVLVGGTFSHATQTHEHGPALSESVEPHTHYKSDGVLVEQNETLHCGSNIFSNLNSSAFCFPKKSGSIPLGSLNVSVENTTEYEPPPPRPIS